MDRVFTPAHMSFNQEHIEAGISNATAQLRTLIDIN
jgi:hypothetical protein